MREIHVDEETETKGPWTRNCKIPESKGATNRRSEVKTKVN